MLVLNTQQNQAIKEIESFLLDDEKDVFILTGSAGTGKTTLIAELIKKLDQLKKTFALLAPTGRASRILSNKIKVINQTDIESSTIHKMIYQLKTIQVNEDETLDKNDPVVRFIYPLKEDEALVSLMIIDESSMIGDKETQGDFIQFGSGQLLRDILEFIRINRLGRNKDHKTKVLFVGDSAQLPPISEDISPALSSNYLIENYGLNTQTFDLSEVVRQDQDSEVLKQATIIRNAIFANKFNEFSIPSNDNDIIQLSQLEAIDWIVSSIKNKKQSVTVVYSNTLSLEYNRSIRQKIWQDLDETIKINDLLLVNKNSTLHQLNNGDMVKVTAIDKIPEIRQISLKVKDKKTNEVKIEEVMLYFRQIQVAYRSANHQITFTNCFILENLLNSPFRELKPIEQRALYVDFLKRTGAKPKTPIFNQLIKSDPYFNALQVKYGYAITCHKAQGGEWESVLVDFTGMKGFNNSTFFRWAYTAITRTSKNLVVINPPNFTLTSTMKWRDNVIESIESIIPIDIEDFEKFNFTSSMQPLKSNHIKLKKYWLDNGFLIENIEHLQYCERYTLSFQGKFFSLQYFYNSKFKVGRFEILKKQFISDDIATIALAGFRLINENKQSSSTKFIDDFIELIDKCLENSTIKRVDHQVMPYRLRINFCSENKQGSIDFNYNAKESWTSVQEVGGIGSTNGLYEEIQKLLSFKE